MSSSNTPASSASTIMLITAVTIGMAATVGGALGFEHIGGYIPCALCLEQRTPYYLAVPVGLLALIALYVKAPAMVSRGLMLIVGLLMTWSLVLAVRHSGVEWGWWAGPADCAATAGNITLDAGNLLNQLNNTKAPSCDEAAGRFLGLSFAGWNAVASVIWLAMAFRAATRIQSRSS